MKKPEHKRVKKVQNKVQRLLTKIWSFQFKNVVLFVEWQEGEFGRKDKGHFHFRHYSIAVQF